MAEDANPNPNDGGTPAEVVRPDALPEAFWDGEAKAPKYTDIGAALGELEPLRALKTAADERAAGVPQDGKYTFGLPEGWKAPDDLKVSEETIKSWNVSEGRQAVLAEIGKELQLSQAQMAGFMGKLAGADIREQAGRAEKIAQAMADDDAKNMAELGEKAVERNENLKAAINAQMGDGMADNIKFLDAATFVAFEKFINGLGSHHAPNKGGALSTERPDASTLTGAQMHRLAIQETAGKRN